jgi:hypothetical protein
MHRLIMLSSTYQMSSQFNPRAAELDPENRMLWRFDIQRLEAEEIRDALLAVSGLLDPSMGGSLLHVKNRQYLFDHTSLDRTKYDVPRRSLYLPVIRNNVYDVFQLFDFADPSVQTGDRATTTVAPQALFMMNSELVAKASDALAAGLLKQQGDDTSRIQTLYLKAYGRPADAREVARARGLTAAFEAKLQKTEPDEAKRHQQALAWTCQVVLAANEFIFIR